MHAKREKQMASFRDPVDDADAVGETITTFTPQCTFAFRFIPSCYGNAM